MKFNLNEKSISINNFDLGNQYNHYSSEIWAYITELATQTGFQKIEISIKSEDISQSQICLEWEKELGVKVHNEVKNHVTSLKNVDGSDENKNFIELIADANKLAEWKEKGVAWKATWELTKAKSLVI
jgi:hypothetical protein